MSEIEFKANQETVRLCRQILAEGEVNVKYLPGRFTTSCEVFSADGELIFTVKQQAMKNALTGKPSGDRFELYTPDSEEMLNISTYDVQPLFEQARQIWRKQERENYEKANSEVAQRLEKRVNRLRGFLPKENKRYSI